MTIQSFQSALHALRLDREFLRTAWRKEAIILPGHARELAAGDTWAVRFKNWCKSPVEARLFATNLDGTSVAATVREPAAAYDLYEQVTAEGREPVTLLLNHVELVDQLVGNIHEAMAVDQDWRRGDIVATLSAPNSGIGYHAGNEDGFIIQLEGTRHWRAWPAEHTPEHYRRELLGLPGPRAARPMRPAASPSVDVILQPGDVMYLPSLFAHEGLTLDRSVSLSVAWRGVTPYALLLTLLGDQLAMLDDVTMKIDAYSSLLPDPPDYETQEDLWTTLVLNALDTVDADLDLRRVAAMRIAEKFERQG